MLSWGEGDGRFFSVGDPEPISPMGSGSCNGPNSGEHRTALVGPFLAPGSDYQGTHCHIYVFLDGHGWGPSQ